jgi:hypothetical protein
MNEYLSPQNMEHIDRLVLGIEPQDALSARRITRPIEIAIDGAPYAEKSQSKEQSPNWSRLFGILDPIGNLLRIPRHYSCRHAFLFKPGVKSPIVIRMADYKRRFVPRRISYPIPADIQTVSPPNRIRQPVLFPGAAYDLHSNATGMRGRVTWSQALANEVPVRWARVEASINGQVVGRAHGDDRGEFLLLLNTSAVGLNVLTAELTILVTVFAPPAPIPLAGNDPLADLPVEILLNDPDDVSPGSKLPPTYAATALSSRSVTFLLGQLLTNQDKFFFTP